MEPRAAAGVGSAGRPASVDSPYPHDGDHPDRRLRRRQRHPRRRPTPRRRTCALRVPPRLTRRRRGGPHRARRTAPQPAAGDRRVLQNIARSDRVRQTGRPRHPLRDRGGNRCPGRPRQRRRRRGSAGLHPRYRPRRISVDATRRSRPPGLPRHPTSLRSCCGAPSQFRPAPPPALTSPRYAADFNEVHSLGELNSATRTPDQTAIAKFWGAAPIWIVWNQIADQAAIGFRQQPRAERPFVRDARHDARRRRDRALRRQVRLPPLASDHRDHRA